ncbi:OPT8 [[Candida] subhashii]|uniref:OPT8 n=1 Tax=[Candida] subhashii TaxID=561895 RepID=A0A8J5UFV1_9ASCO|nr:OPT8 [[Candida] subhashii]KAG7662118.1 OPT8 [[Candida] subhashii]
MSSPSPKSRHAHQDSSYLQKLCQPQVTIRGTLVGLFIGSIILISNFQFGLQTGWVSMMSLPAALLGFALFRASPYLSKNFTDVENVYIQSVAVAVGTGPLCYGFIGIIPAIEKFLTVEETGMNKLINFSLKELMIWSLGLGMFGVFFAIPLRKQVIVKEKLPFPSGSATATLISVLHGTEMFDDSKPEENSTDPKDEEGEPHPLGYNDDHHDIHCHIQSPTLVPVTSIEELEEDYDSNMHSLISTFTVSATYTILAFFFPILKQIPIFGNYLSKTYQWNFQPSPAYIGQGIIMGLPTVSYMLFGTILGWAILAPLSKYKGWAPGEINDWINGGQGWILWISLSVMISDSLVSFVIISFKSLRNAYQFIQSNNNNTPNTPYTQISSIRSPPVDLTFEMRRSDSDYGTINYENPAEQQSDVEDEDEDIPHKYLISTKAALLGLLISTILCITSLRLIFPSDLIPIQYSLVAILLAMIFAILAVRALGETDLNPVSGIGKLSQLVFGLIIPASHPARILINLIAGGIAEAGAQQAGDLMQDLKTGHMIGASPKAQFQAQIVGTLYSVVLSSVMYRVYNSMYEIPGDVFRIPTAVIWVDCSRLVTGQGLPPKAFEFSLAFGVVFGVISFLKNTVGMESKLHKWLVFLPSGVAVGIGIYNIPSFTIARFIGGVIAYWWMHSKSGNKMLSNKRNNNRIGMIIFSSGLVLGEGLLSGFTMLLTSLGVGHF